MKVILCAITLLLAPISWDACEHLTQRHDTTPEYVVFGANKLEVQNTQGQYDSHIGAYHAKDQLFYCIERKAARTVTARSSRRIVQRVVDKQGAVGKKLIYTFPAVNSSVTVRQTPPGVFEAAHVMVELPGADILPPGKQYVIESGVEFPSKGERDAQTYTSDSESFDVE